MWSDGELSRTVEEICQDLKTEFSEGAPTEQVVRSQGFDYLTRHWTDRWPRQLPLPDALSGPERRHVSRSELFAMAAEVHRICAESLRKRVRVGYRNQGPEGCESCPANT